MTTCSGLTGVIQQLNSALRNAFPRSSRSSRTYIEIARSHNVTELNVVEACDEVEDWLEMMENILEGMKCPAYEWANAAGYFLQGNARYWWKSVTSSYPRTL